MSKTKIAYSILFGVLLILLVGFIYLPLQDEPAPTTTPLAALQPPEDSVEIISNPVTTVTIEP
ncbi:MAG: hypothetical protein IT213_07655, partial [Cytophagales bacterium]|nr:hypothetical protein [Cytophagales bacterium]